MDFSEASFQILIGHDLCGNLNQRTTLNDDIFVSWEGKTDFSYFQGIGYEYG